MGSALRIKWAAFYNQRKVNEGKNCLLWMKMGLHTSLPTSFGAGSVWPWEVKLRIIIILLQISERLLTFLFYMGLGASVMFHLLQLYSASLLPFTTFWWYISWTISNLYWSPPKVPRFLSLGPTRLLQLPVSLSVCAQALIHVWLCKPMNWHSPGSLSIKDSPGRNPGMGSRFLLQGMFHTQGFNLCLPHCRFTLFWSLGTSYLYPMLFCPCNMEASSPNSKQSFLLLGVFSMVSAWTLAWNLVSKFL